MDRIEAMEVFVRVVDSKGFSKAAEYLDLPLAKVSRVIQSLEKHLGVRLLNRTTRVVNITEDGVLFYERCVQILAEISDAESSLSNKRKSPTGILRVDTSGTLARALLVPHLKSFYEKYPEIEVRLGLADRNIDLIQDGVDCVIRMGHLGESSLIAKKIGDAQVVTCAAPAYLKKYGVPSQLKELQNHHAVNYVSAQTGKIFPFEFFVNGELSSVAMQAALSVNDGSVYIQAGIAGYGIIQPSRFMVDDLLKAGELIQILAEQDCPTTPLSIVYPHRIHLGSKLRAFVDWIIDVTSDLPGLAVGSVMSRPKA